MQAKFEAPEGARIINAHTETCAVTVERLLGEKGSKNIEAKKTIDAGAEIVVGPTLGPDGKMLPKSSVCVVIETSGKATEVARTAQGVTVQIEPQAS